MACRRVRSHFEFAAVENALGSVIPVFTWSQKCAEQSALLPGTQVQKTKHRNTQTQMPELKSNPRSLQGRNSKNSQLMMRLLKKTSKSNIPVLEYFLLVLV
jgi:hypothetical protein